MRKNRKYNGTFKEMVVKEYLSGKNGGLNTVAKICGVRNVSQLKKWGKKYHEDPTSLHRDFKAKAPFEKLITDVSYIYHKTGRLFLSFVKDLFDNSILAYQISQKNDIKLVMDNLSQVFSKRSNNCILHSDQGFQYTSRIYKDTLESLSISDLHNRRKNKLNK